MSFKDLIKPRIWSSVIALLVFLLVPLTPVSLFTLNGSVTKYYSVLGLFINHVGFSRQALMSYGVPGLILIFIVIWVVVTIVYNLILSRLKK